MKIKDHFLNSGQFLEEETTKNKIILHHTVSSSALSTINWWNQDPKRIATHFIIDKDGTIFRCFPEKYWAYHIGKGSTSNDNRKSFGIELVNEGPLILSNGVYKWFDGKAIYNESIHEANWRGYQFWAKYTSEQLGSLGELLIYLTDKYNISKDIITSYEYDQSYFDFSGILSHHNLRSDKTDVSPALDLVWLNRAIKSINSESYPGRLGE